MMSTDRIGYFEDYLKKKPDDDFAQYALAMEYGKIGRNEEAMSLYKKLTTRNRDYSAGYHQWGIMLQSLERYDEAREVLAQGIQAARRSKNSHAEREMEELLEDIEGL